MDRPVPAENHEGLKGPQCDTQIVWDLAPISVLISASLLAIGVMAGALGRTEEPARKILMSFKIIDVDIDIADYAITLRQDRRLSVTDAIIVATAQATGRTLITRDAKLENEFDDPPVVVPYQV